MSAKDISGRMNAYYTHPDNIVVRAGWNPRFDFGEIKDLAASMTVKDGDGQLVGVLVPLRVRRNSDGKLELIDGERRLRAARLAKLDRVPVVLDNKLSDTEALVRALVANTGKPLLPLEEAAALLKLKDTSGMTILQLSKAVGRSDIYVMDRIKLLSAPEEVKEAVAAGTLGTTLAAEIVTKEKDPEKQVKLAQKATKGKLERREVRAELAKNKGNSAKQVPKFVREMAQAEVAALEDRFLELAIPLCSFLGLPTDPEKLGSTEFLYSLHQLLSEGETEIILKETKKSKKFKPVSFSVTELVSDLHNTTDTFRGTPEEAADLLNSIPKLAVMVGTMYGIRLVVGDN